MAIKLNVNKAPFRPLLDDDDSDERRQRLLQGSLGQKHDEKKAAVEAASKAPLEGASKVASKAPLEGASKAASKPAVEAASKPAVEAASKPAVEAASKPAVEAASKPAVEAASKPAVEAASKPAVEAALNKEDKYLISKNITLFLSPSLRYTRIKSANLKVLVEIAKLCILAGKLQTEMESYEFIASKLEINGHTLRGIVRKLESEGMLVLRDEHYISGSRGRIFEISAQALNCLLHNDKSLKSWLSRHSISLATAKKLFDFK